MPRGVSFEASLMMPASSSPISRASSEIGLPGWYGAIERTYEGDSSHRSISIFLSAHRGGVRSQDFQKRGLLSQLGERLPDARVLLVPLDVDEEHVLPQRGAGARRARLDAAHADAVLRERRQERAHRAGLVFGRTH